LKDESYDALKQEVEKRQLFEPKINKTTVKLTASSITPKRNKTSLLADCYDPDPSVETIPNDETEIERYLKTCFTLDSATDNLFEFWEQQQDMYPILSSIALDILIIPASNTSVERLFSTSEAIVTNKRNRLNTAKIDKLMFLKSNLTFLKSFHHTGGADTSSTAASLINKPLYEIIDDVSNDDEDNENISNKNEYEDDDLF